LIYLGHNPLGAAMVLALLMTVAVVAALGLFAIDDNDLTGGPLYPLVAEATRAAATRWHEWTFYWPLLVLIGIHIVANVLYATIGKDPLIKAMITGRKPAASYADDAGADSLPRPIARALGCLAAAAALVFGSIVLAGGRLT
jgi:cytochrome b